MAYLGQGPFQEFTNPPTKDSFTGDGSTTTFDLAATVPSNAQNALEVYVDNVRQEPGTGKAFTLGVDGSNDHKRITFSSAPASGASIYVINDKTNTSVTAPLQNDLNGTELILDGDGDTSITADSDDRIDFKIANTDHFHIGTSSGDTVFQNKTDAKDFLFNQYDGRTILEINDAGYVALANGATGSGELRIYEDTDNGTNYSGFKVGTQSADIDYVLPTADGSSGQHLTTNGSGTLSWAAAVAANPASADGDSLGTTSLEWSDLYLADGGIIYLGADQDTTLTHVADTGILLNSSRQLQFGDSGTYIHQSADGVLDLVSDTEIEINATTIDINGAVQISGTTTIAGNLVFGSATVTEAQLEILDGATVTTDELNIIDGGTSASSVTVADADRVVFNDGGTMKQVAVTDLAAYFDDEITSMPNLTTAAALVTVSALDTGSITSGFGNIDNGASNITSGGLVKLDVDADADDVTGDSATGRLTLGAGEDLNLYHGGTNSYIVNDTGDLILKTGASDEDMIFQGNDGGAAITALTLDMSAAGAAAFNSTVTATGFIIGSANIAEAELEQIGGITAGTVLASKALIVDSDKKLNELTVDDVAIDGKVITMTGSSGDTFVTTVAANGATSLVTTDASAAAANLQITADGTVDIDSAGVLTLDSGAAINIEPAAGSAILLDGTISVDAGVVTGATSITSTAFVGSGASLTALPAAQLTGTVATANIADNAITLAKMAGGTDGNLITYDASGDPAYVATGSDGQVLTSTGAGSAPAFEALPASGKVIQMTSKSTGSTAFSNSSGTVTLDTLDFPAAHTSGNGVFLGYPITTYTTSANGDDAWIYFKVMDGSTELDSQGRYYFTSGAIGYANHYACVRFAAINSTATLTVKITAGTGSSFTQQVNTQDNAHAFFIQEIG